MLGDGPTFAINESFGSTGKMFSINFSKANQKNCLSLQCNAENSYFLKIENKSLILMPTLKMLTFQLNFVPRAYLIDLMILNLEKYL